MNPGGRLLRSAVFVALLLAASACRDEQAGPKRRPGRPPPTGAAIQTAPVLEAAPADLTYRSNATWADGAIRYLGSRLTPANPRPGQRVQLNHYFVAQKPPPQGWAFFAHLVDAQGTMIANVDHPFGSGALPLERWPVGKVVVDQHELEIPQVPARLLMGFWQGESRLPVDDPRQHDGSGRVLGPPLGGGPEQESLPEYKITRAPRPPTIDGDLGDPVWNDAAAVVLRGSFDGRPAPLRTTARLLYDDAALYVAFDAEDPDVWGTLMKRDDPIYSQEVVEIFLDADANLRTYNELQVSPNNVTFDAYFPARRQGMDLGWDSKMTTAVKVNGTVNHDGDRDQGWSAELRIPFASLADVPNVPPKVGDRWRFNLYRLELPDRRSQQGQAFSPLFVGDFHALPRFGWLTFE